MGLALYRLLLRLGLPVAALRHWLRHRGEAGRNADWREFFGYYSDRTIRSIVWLHAASANAALAAAPLVRALRGQYPDHEILITSGTIAGRETLRHAFGEQVLLAYLPYDLPGAARRFLEHFRPRLGAVIGVEVWPVLLATCRQRGVPLMLANARLSSDLARSYARFATLSRLAFGCFAASCAQDRATARRLRRLGAEAVAVTGNVIFDSQSDPTKVEEGRALMAALRGRKALLLAGTCEGEEEMLLDALGQDDGTLIIIVPRHPERYAAVAELAAERGINVARRSKGEAPHVGRRVFLGDTVGEMPFYYAVSTVAIIGGSFTSAGGQDPIEACAAGVPAVIGPHMVEFAEATRAALVANAAIRVVDAGEAIRVARNLLEIREWRERMALAGLKLSAAHRGATERHLAVCRRLLPPTAQQSD
ncbi:MAG: glycosyltransferase N-terminal domain-containing protein [Burkholderiales bacterium]